MRVLLSIYSLAYLAIVVSALTTQQPNQDPLVQNGNNLAMVDSAITSDNTFARNDPECTMDRRYNNRACEGHLCRGTPNDDTGGWCQYDEDDDECYEVNMRGDDAHVACLNCICVKI